MKKYKQDKYLIEETAQGIAFEIFEKAKENSTTLPEFHNEIEVMLKNEFGGYSMQHPVGALIKCYIRELQSTMEITIK